MFHQVIGILELAARAGQLSSSVVDTTSANRKRAPTNDLPRLRNTRRPRTQTPATTGSVASPPAPRGGRAARSGGDELPPEDGQVPAPPADPRQKLIRKAVSLGHSLVIRPSYVFCRRCARYAEKRWQGLDRDPCRGLSATAHDGNLKRLWQGRNPKTGKPFGGKPG